MAQQRDPIYAASRAGRVADQEIVPQARAQLLPYISADAVAEVDDAHRLQGLNESARERRALWALTLVQPLFDASAWGGRSEEHTSELQSLMRISYAGFCLKKKNTTN